MHPLYLSVTTNNPGNPAVSQIIVSTASALSTALLFWLIRILRGFMREHEWLMETTKQNTEDIKHILELQESREQRARGSNRRNG